MSVLRFSAYDEVGVELCAREDLEVFRDTAELTVTETTGHDITFALTPDVASALAEELKLWADRTRARGTS